VVLPVLNIATLFGSLKKKTRHPKRMPRCEVYQIN
jgi:hypothetical protein